MGQNICKTAAITRWQLWVRISEMIQRRNVANQNHGASMYGLNWCSSVKFKIVKKGCETGQLETSQVHMFVFESLQILPWNVRTG